MDAEPNHIGSRAADHRASANVQQKLDDLAEKSSAGAMTSEERADDEACVWDINFIGVLQADARKLIATDAAT